MNNEGSPDSDFTAEAKARRAALEDACATECADLMKTYVLMLKDPRTQQRDCTAAFFKFDECVANCAAKKQKLQEIQPLAARVLPRPFA